jgi:hypothetical protein
MNLSFRINEDFAVGALTVGLLMVAKKLYDLFQFPSAASLEKQATLPVPHLGEDSMITVWGFTKYESDDEIKNACYFDHSIYVDRVEAYLRLKKQKYIKEKTQGLRENPRHKVPFANIFGVMIDDSHRILSKLQEILGDDTDNNLSAAQLAQGHMIRATLTGSLYWTLLYSSFGTEEGRQSFRQMMAKEIPWFIFPAVMAIVFWHQTNYLQSAGIAKLPRNEVIEIAKKDLRAIQTALGNQSFILGTKDATAYDTDVYSFVNHVFNDPHLATEQWVLDIKKELPELVHYVHRIRRLLEGEAKLE